MKKNPNQTANLKLLAKPTDSRLEELNKIERITIANFAGQFNDLETALGILRMGDHVGWKVLILIHNKRTIRKYEEILGINFREFFPDEGPSIGRSVGYQFVQKLGNFWKAVSGDVKIEKKREFSR